LNGWVAEGDELQSAYNSIRSVENSSRSESSALTKAMNLYSAAIRKSSLSSSYGSALYPCLVQQNGDCATEYNLSEQDKRILQASSVHRFTKQQRTFTE
jgi:hypothetical protein